MRIHIHAVAIVLIVLTLSACTLTPPSEQVPSPTPTLNSEGASFLSVVCPADLAIADFNLIWSDQSSGLGDIVAAASSAGAATRNAAAGLESGAWSREISAEVVLVMDDYLVRATDFDSIAKAADLDSLTTFEFTYSEEALAAAARIGETLGVNDGGC